MSSIALLGLRCSGKSTVGRLLAKRLNRPFLDSDAELARSFGGGATAGDLLERLGEPAFRRLEWRTLARILDRDESVVLATGGGCVSQPFSRELLGRRSLGVYLAARPELLRERAERDATLRPQLFFADRFGGVPLELEDQLAAREALFLDLASIVIDTNGESAEEIAHHIEEELRRGASSGR